MKNFRKQTMTLLEVMIVIFIIGIIGSVIGYNMRGSLDKGKAFKTKEAISKIYEISLLAWEDKSQVSDDPQKIKEMLVNSGFIRKVSDFMKDGWKQQFEFSIDKDSNELRIISRKYEEFCDKERKGKELEEGESKNYEYPWESED